MEKKKEYSLLLKLRLYDKLYLATEVPSANIRKQCETKQMNAEEKKSPMR